ERRATLVLAVVPLHQLVARNRTVSVASQPAGLDGALQRARQNEREAPASERAADALRLVPALLGERDVGPAGVPLVRAPVRLAVTDDNYVLRHRVSLTRRGLGGTEWER